MKGHTMEGLCVNLGVNPIALLPLSYAPLECGWDVAARSLAKFAEQGGLRSESGDPLL